MADVALLATPNFDWNMFLHVTQPILGYAPSGIADASPRNLSDHATILSALESFRDRDVRDAISAIRESEYVQGLLGYAFLIGCPSTSLLEIYEYNLRLHITTPIGMTTGQQVLAVVYGALDDWKQAVIMGCSDGSSQDVRLLFGKIYLHFEKLGLGEIWSKYNRVAHKDKTFLLEFNG